MNYTKLVDINIWHYYYRIPDHSQPWPNNYDIRRDLEIVPSPECEQAMQNARIKFRPTAKGFQLFIQSEDNKPFIPVEENAKWTFYLKLRNPHWVNFTNQRIQETIANRDEKSFIWYFSNLSGKKEGTTLFLSKSLLNYDPDTQYLLGDMILGNNKMVKEAVVNIEKPAGNFKTDQWYDTGYNSVHFANPQDRLSVHSQMFVYRRDNANPGQELNFEIKNSLDDTVDLGYAPGTSQRQDTYITSSNTTEPVYHKLYFNQLPPGKYKLIASVNSSIEAEYVFYLLDPMRDRNVAGVIEIFSPKNRDYSLFDSTDNTVKSKTYEICFKNRLTKWKYIKKDGNSFFESGYQPLSIFSTNLQDQGKTLPDPTVNLIYREHDGINEIIVSKIYLNNTF